MTMEMSFGDLCNTIWPILYFATVFVTAIKILGFKMCVELTKELVKWVDEIFDNAINSVLNFVADRYYFDKYEEEEF